MLNRPFRKVLPFSLALALTACTSAPTTTPNVPVPAAPAPVVPAATPMPTMAAATLSGVALFRGEPLANYHVKVYDAVSGKQLFQNAGGVFSLGTSSPASNAPILTDAKGAFSFKVEGLAPGKALRVTANSESGSILVQALMNGVTAAQNYRIQEAVTVLTLDEVSTALARAADGVLQTTRLLDGQAADPVISKLLTDFAALAGQLKAATKNLADVARAIVATGSDRTLEQADANVGLLFANAGLVKQLNQLVAQAVSQVASAVTDPAKRSTDAQNQALQEVLKQITFVGTVLTGTVDFTKNTVTLTNKLTGGSIDVTTAGLNDSSVVTTTSVGGGGSSRPSSRSVLVHNQQEFDAAIADLTVSEITIVPNIPTYRVLDVGNQIEGFYVAEPTRFTNLGGTVGQRTATTTSLTGLKIAGKCDAIATITPSDSFSPNFPSTPSTITIDHDLTVLGNGKTIGHYLSIEANTTVTLSDWSINVNGLFFSQNGAPNTAIVNKGNLTLLNTNVTLADIHIAPTYDINTITNTTSTASLSVTGGTITSSSVVAQSPRTCGIYSDGMGPVTVDGTTFNTQATGIQTNITTTFPVTATNCTFNVSGGLLPVGIVITGGSDPCEYVDEFSALLLNNFGTTPTKVNFNGQPIDGALNCS